MYGEKILIFGCANRVFSFFLIRYNTIFTLIQNKQKQKQRKHFKQMKAT